MSRLLRFSASTAGKMAFTPHNIILRQRVARIHKIKLLELHNTLHPEKEPPLQLHRIRLHDSTLIRPETSDEMDIRTTKTNSEARELKVQCRCFGKLHPLERFTGIPSKNCPMLSKIWNLRGWLTSIVGFSHPREYCSQCHRQQKCQEQHPERDRRWRWTFQFYRPGQMTAKMINIRDITIRSLTSFTTDKLGISRNVKPNSDHGSIQLCGVLIWTGHFACIYLGGCKARGANWNFARRTHFFIISHRMSTSYQ